MTLMLLMNMGFAGGGTPVTFLAAWAHGSNVLLTPGRHV
jgi:hypothetical protein